MLCEGFDDAADVQALADRLLEAVRDPVDVDGTEVRIGITIGVAEPAAETRVDELIRQADSSMYEAKARSRADTRERS